MMNSNMYVWMYGVCILQIIRKNTKFWQWIQMCAQMQILSALHFTHTYSIHIACFRLFLLLLFRSVQFCNFQKHIYWFIAGINHF